ncbi:MAG: sugar ABC transporter permease [Candidatus Dormiibacterota bacterium]
MSVSVAAAPLKRTRRRGRSYALPFFFFTGPLLIGLAIFTFIPIVWGFLLSFSRGRGSVAVGPWVGVQNYATLLEDPAFRESLATIVAYTIIIVPVTFVISLGLALLVNQAHAGRAFFRTVFFIPFAVSYVVASLVWKLGLFNVPSGAITEFLSLFGLPSIAFISTASPPLYWVVLASVRLWLQVGYYMIIFIVGLQEIPEQLYEAARTDGARRWSTFWRITMPMLRNTSVAILILLLINAFQAFDEFYNIMGGELGGANASLARTPLEYLYSTALGSQDYGQAAAGSFILTALIVLVSVIQARVFGFGGSMD